jgi:hypothetical protein
MQLEQTHTEIIFHSLEPTMVPLNIPMNIQPILQVKLKHNHLNLLTMQCHATEVGKRLLWRVPDLSFAPFNLSLHHKCPVCPCRPMVELVCWQVDYGIIIATHPEVCSSLY